MHPVTMHAVCGREAAFTARVGLAATCRRAAAKAASGVLGVSSLYRLTGGRRRAAGRPVGRVHGSLVAIGGTKASSRVLVARANTSRTARSARALLHSSALKHPPRRCYHEADLNCHRLWCVYSRRAACSFHDLADPDNNPLQRPHCSYLPSPTQPTHPIRQIRRPACCQTFQHNACRRARFSTTLCG